MVKDAEVKPLPRHANVVLMVCMSVGGCFFLMRTLLDGEDIYGSLCVTCRDKNVGEDDEG